MSVPDVTERKLTWRERLTLSKFMTILVASCIIFSTCLIAYFSITRIYEEKVKDIWALLYLEVENLSIDLQTQIRDRYDPRFSSLRKSLKTKKRLATYLSKDNFNFRLRSGKFQEKLHINELNIMEKLRPQRFYFTVMGDMQLLLRNSLVSSSKHSGQKLFMLEIWPVNISSFIPIKSSRLVHTVLYVLNKAGSLLHRNNKEITQGSVLKRPLVKHFIKSNYERAQSQIVNKDGEKIFGFYFEVPQTNVVVFAETSRMNALSEAYKIMVRFAILGLGVLIFSILFVNIFLGSIKRGLRDLISHTNIIAKGKFKDFKFATSFGEISILSTRFSQMSRGLMQRDKTINNLLIERVNRIKLESSLEIAKSLQENFLPDQGTIKNDILELNFHYKSMEKVGGDWLQFHIFEETGEAIVAIGDISGHGPGASMFTAVVSAEFDRFIEQGDPNLIGEFIASLNRRVLRFGKSKWMVTFQVLSYLSKERKLKVYNFGHVPPFMMAKHFKKAKLVQIPSNPLGLEENVDIKFKEFEVKDSVDLTLYTDCLIEAENRQGKRFKKSKLLKIVEEIQSIDGKRGLNKILQQWTKFHSESEIDDDLCLIKIRFL